MASVLSNSVIKDTVIIANDRYPHGRGIKTLFRASQPHATHDSSLNQFFAHLPETLHPDLVDLLADWVTGGYPVYHSLWIVGSRSNLPHLCARKLQSHLAASYFFSGENRITDATQFFPTIAYRLASHFPAYWDILDAKLSHDPALVLRAMEIQFRDLIAEPFRLLRARGEDSIFPRSLILVSDFDQCSGEEARLEILRILTTESQLLPFRWIFFSEPDAAVNERLVEFAHMASSMTIALGQPDVPDGGCRGMGVILSGTSNSVIRDNIFIANDRYPRGRGIKALLRASQQHATHDSSLNQFISHLPKTSHTDLVDVLADWALGEHSAYHSLWVVGPRSNLPHLCARKLQNNLVASYFFSEENRITDPSQFFPTIAYRLAIHLPAYWNILDAKLSRDPALASRSLKIQFRELISEPFQKLRARGEISISPRPLILVSGFDQCNGDEARLEILRILTTESERIPFRWIFFSESDAAVTEWLTDFAHTAISALTALDQPDVSVEGCGDIGLCMIQLEGNGIWLRFFGSLHIATHVAVVFFLTPEGPNPTVCLDVN
ncbi:hypothetical protein NP233_g9014 [Leucocoprinus birnbaumii]|uniref:Nephrocystin 3-like N-terminal domain-containing protein n=1 Tax=Leucocoprinus birnbaumii TaxID=56174 RepID=A0AAD5VLX1_9AGAR|nr:hypothetical protein NP233_g9014 [Leucocoprinus birnbaumii]